MSVPNQYCALGARVRRAGASDDIADTVDYRAVKKDVLAMVEASIGLPAYARRGSAP